MPKTPASVLVVDDRPDICRLVSRAFEGRYRILSDTNPHRALESAGREPPALAVLDVFMTAMDGRSLCRRLLPQGVRSILYSGEVEESLEDEAYAAGALSFRLKPDLIAGLRRDLSTYFSEPVPARVPRRAGVGLGRSVLVIDDEDHSRDSALEALAFDGFLPYGAASGREGLLLAAALEPEAVLLDFHLPDLDITRMLKSLKAGPRPPTVVVWTGAEVAAQETYWRGLGAADYRIKCVHSLAALGPALAENLRRPPAPPPEVRAGDLVLDTLGRTVRLGEGRRVDLSQMECVLLAALAREAGTLLSWRRLMLDVFGLDDRTVLSYAPPRLRTLAHRLCEALAALGVGIETVKGAGLRLNVPL